MADNGSSLTFFQVDEFSEVGLPVEQVVPLRRDRLVMCSSLLYRTSVPPRVREAILTVLSFFF